MDKTTDDIEREIERERVALSRSLDSLNRMFSRDALTDQAIALLRDNGGDLTGAVLRQVKANPMALALTGAGLAWLATGSERPDPARPARKLVRRKPAPKVAYDHRSRPPAPGFRHADHPDLADLDLSLVYGSVSFALSLSLEQNPRVPSVLLSFKRYSPVVFRTSRFA